MLVTPSIFGNIRSRYELQKDKGDQLWQLVEAKYLSVGLNLLELIMEYKTYCVNPETHACILYVLIVLIEFNSSIWTTCYLIKMLYGRLNQML